MIAYDTISASFALECIHDHPSASFVNALVNATASSSQTADSLNLDRLPVTAAAVAPAFAVDVTAEPMPAAVERGCCSVRDRLTLLDDFA